jgi:hypothetical protein
MSGGPGLRQDDVELGARAAVRQVDGRQPCTHRLSREWVLGQWPAEEPRAGLEHATPNHDLVVVPALHRDIGEDPQLEAHLLDLALACHLDREGALERRLEGDRDRIQPNLGRERVQVDGRGLEEAVLPASTTPARSNAIGWAMWTVSTVRGSRPIGRSMFASSVQSQRSASPSNVAGPRPGTSKLHCQVIGWPLTSRWLPASSTSIRASSSTRVLVTRRALVPVPSVRL